MEWEKAKKIFIYILVVINIVLLGLNLKNNHKYTITSAQERAVYTLLSNNGIGLYTELIENFEPMRQLAVSAKTTDAEEIKNNFFDEGEVITITVEFDSTIYKSGKKTVTVSDNSSILYNNPEGTGEIKTLNRKNAIDEAERFISVLGFENTRTVKMESIKQKDEGYIVKFSESYDDIKMFCSVEDVYVTERGVVEAKLVFYTPDGYIGERKEICSCDEALLTVLYDMNEDGGVKNGTYIEKIELGYDFQEERDISEVSILRLVPCYRVFASNRENPYLVNAYTNTIID